jgi:carbonic anhydrase
MNRKAMLKFKYLLLVAALTPFLIFFVYQRQKKNHSEQYGLLQNIMLGNSRFAHNAAIRPHTNAAYIKSIASEQHPHAVVVACADSRVSPEIVFDEGLGDLFVIRTAGNMVDELELASIEYAVEHLGVQLIMVMGHENCGAVKALVESTSSTGHIKTLIDSLRKEPEIAAVPADDPERLTKTIKANVMHHLHTIETQSAVVAEKLEAGKLQLVGTYYDLHNRSVSILKQ